MIWHVLTGEYPPGCGGVGDYTANLAAALTAAGDRVHVWTPGTPTDPPPDGVELHALPDWFGPRSEAALRAAIDGQNVTLLLQYVPNALGRRGANLPFCRAFARMRRRGADIRVMFHEPYFYFSLVRPWRIVLALAQRRMASVLLAGASHVYLSTETWRRYLKIPPGTPVSVLPIPSSLPGDPSTGGIRAARTALAGNGAVVGHFGTYGAHVGHELDTWIPRLLKRTSARLLLIGDGSDVYAWGMSSRSPAFAGRVTGTGRLSPEEAAVALAACDLLIQPYPDGVTTRRTSIMAGLQLGVATVTTRGELTEPIWGESGAVALVQVDDDATDVIASLLADDEARRRQAAAGRLAYSQHFSMAQTVVRLRAKSVSA